jgi:hypothetical protein
MVWRSVENIDQPFALGGRAPRGGRGLRRLYVASAKNKPIRKYIAAEGGNITFTQRIVIMLSENR